MGTSVTSPLSTKEGSMKSALQPADTDLGAMLTEISIIGITATAIVQEVNFFAFLSLCILLVQL